MAISTQVLFPNTDLSTNLNFPNGSFISPLYGENGNYYGPDNYTGIVSNPTYHIKDGTILSTATTYLTPSGLNSSRFFVQLKIPFSGIGVSPSGMTSRMAYDFTRYSGTNVINWSSEIWFEAADNPLLNGVSVNTHSNTVSVFTGASGVTISEMTPITNKASWFPASGNIFRLYSGFDSFVSVIWNSGDIRFIDIDILASGQINTNNNNCNLYMGGRTPNPPLITQVLLPNTGVPSYWSGSGLKIPQGTILQGSPTTGVDSIANSVKDGTTTPTKTSYWTNNGPPDGQSVMSDYWFDLGFDKINIGSPSGITARFAHNRALGLSSLQIALSGANLYYKKSNNPYLSNDILFASGELSYTGISLSGVVDCKFLIVDANRSLFPANGYLSLSGHLLSTATYIAASGGITIYDWDLITSGTTYSDSCSLYTNGLGLSSGNVNLYLDNHVPTSSSVMNLFLKGQTPNSGNSNIDLFTWSTTNSGVFKTLPLTVWQSSDYPDPTHSLNLFTKVIDYSSSSSSMNLFTGNDTTTHSGLNLFLQNSYLENSGNLNLYLAAPSGTYGAVPNSGTMNLFINRNSEATAGNVNLYLKQVDRVSGVVPLYMNGANISSQNVNLFTKALISTSGTLPLSMTAYGGGGTIPITPPALVLWAPDNLSNPPVCWLKADSLSLNDGDTISTWTDSSNNSHDAIGSSTTKPIFKTNILNSLPVVRMDGTKSLNVTNLGTALSTDDTYSVFIFIRPNTVANYPVVLAYPTVGNWTWILEYETAGGFYWGQQNPDYRLYNTNISGGNITLIELIKSTPTTGKLYKNSSEITVFSINGGGLLASPTMTGDMLLGQYTSAGFGLDGDLLEIIICNTTLSDTDRKLVEGYLAWKWGQQSNLPIGHPYKSAAPTI